MKASKKTAIVLLVFSFFITAPNLYAKEKPYPPDRSSQWMQIDPIEVYPDFEYNGLTPACASCPPTVDMSKGTLKFYDPKFTFMVKKGTSKNLVIYFQGGGACWDSLNCIYVHTYYEEVPPIQLFSNTEGKGIFDTANPENPFKDWSFVYIPYCTGDIHWGSKDTIYEAIPQYTPLVASSAASFKIKHRGFVNFMAVLKWTQDNFPNPSRIFVTGSSAGSYGAIMGFPYVKEAYPKVHVSVLGDAGNGVVSEEFQAESIPNWGYQDNMPDWIPGFQRDVAGMTIADSYKITADYYSHSKVGQYTTAFDWNQTFFYAVMLDIESGFPNPASWEENSFWQNQLYSWHNQMLDLVYSASASPNYRYYIAPGYVHTIMMDPLFYTQSSNGVLFKDWLKAMVFNEGGTNAHGAMPWVNIECVDCVSGD